MSENSKQGPEVFETPAIQFATDPLPTNKAQASSDYLANLRRALDGAVAAVKVATEGRDGTQNGRFRYERNWTRLRAAIKQVVLATGKPIDLPVVYHAPPSMAQQSTRFRPEDFPTEDGTYRETGGLGSGGKGLERGIPGTAQELAWINLQGETK